MITRNGKLRSLRARAGMGALAALSVLAMGASSAQAAPSRLAGTDAIGSHVSSAANGSAEVYQTTASRTGDTTSISVHLDSTSDASGLEVGVYSDVNGQPTTLLTSARKDGLVAGFNEVAVPTARLVAGQKYWIAVLNPADGTGTLRWTDRAGGSGGGEQTSSGVDLVTLPDEWVTGGVWSDGPLSAFITGEPYLADGPTLAVEPSALSFWANSGTNPAPKTLDITNSGTGSFTYSVSESIPWLSVSGATGTLPGAPQVAIDARNLGVGTHTGTIRINANAAEAPRDVVVTLTINPAGGTSGLVGAWNFDETSGDSVLDASGNRNTGTIQGATRTTGKYGRGLQFDGADDWVTVADANSLDLRTGLTLEAWVKPEELGTMWRTVVIKEQTDQLAYALYANTDAGKPSGHVFTSSDNGLAGPDSLPTGRWSHVATTWDGATSKLYVNGELVASRPVTGTAVVSNGALRIGGNAVWAEWFKGSIDEVRVYNRALSAEQILADADTPIGKGTGSQMSPLEQLKALLLKLLAKWKKHFGDWTWHGHRGYFHGGR